MHLPDSVSQLFNLSHLIVGAHWPRATPPYQNWVAPSIQWVGEQFLTGNIFSNVCALLRVSCTINSVSCLSSTTLTNHHAFTISFQAQNSSFFTNVSTIVWKHPPDCLLGLHGTRLNLLNGFRFLTAFHSCQSWFL